ncbi:MULTISPECIES: single-stranded-DNA-specific exonuclease RecJ [Bacillus]|uniref:single-stranded-DNA-specific exonuclease RecJ n=1 Tax=Bacillus TaxID=1386 RepID=UPI0002F2A2C1|nr:MULTISPECIES: single-stranded-DNA-specific exonuclease RecJ [Bacillus]
MLQSKSRWNVEKSNQQAVEMLTNELHITPLVAQLLVNRGMETVDSARSFLFIEQLEFHDPYLLKDMDKAVKRIHEAIDNRENILIFGDYDADGVSSTTVLMETLSSLGANVDFYIPNRFTEGYGPNEGAFQLAKDHGTDLIITVDTGISALHEANVAKELGMDYIITDHHEPGPELPEAFAIIHPKLKDSTYPCKDLAGVGVAFKLAHALLGEIPENLLEIVAIGTIADLVPLKDENRLIAAKGIQKMKQTSRPGLLALFNKAGIELESLNEDSIGFGIAPRINAAGRLADADPAVDLLLTNDSVYAQSIAEEIDSMNKERQTIVAEITKEAIKQVEEEFPIDENNVLIVGAEGWNAGVIGIVASKLVEKYYRPTIVLSYDNEKGLAKGSARSIAGFDLYHNLSKCRDILPHFGGHPMAAGMTLKIEDVSDLRNRLNKLATEVLSEEDFIPITNIDASIRLEDVNLETIEEMGKLSPFGMSNPKPRVLLSDIHLATMKRIGAEGNHLKALLKDQDYTLDAVGFGMGDVSDEVTPNAVISVIGELAINEWNNIRKPQIFLQDLSVNHWQLFDIRGNKKLSQLLAHIPEKQTKIIFFNEQFVQYLPAGEKRQVVIIDNEDKALAEDLTSQNVLLVDMPSNEEYLYKLLSGKKPSRVYTHFYQNQQHFFSTIPTRDDFKWFYALLLKKGSFDVNRYREDIAKHKGWSLDTVGFICQVFFELNFVTMDNGFISIIKQPQKRDVSEAPSYIKKQQQIKLENELLYSSYQQLYDKMQSYLDGKELKEEITSWI